MWLRVVTWPVIWVKGLLLNLATKFSSWDPHDRKPSPTQTHIHICTHMHIHMLKNVF